MDDATRKAKQEAYQHAITIVRETYDVTPGDAADVRDATIAALVDAIVALQRT